MITLIIIIYDKNFSCSSVEGFIGSELLINPLRLLGLILFLYYKILITIELLNIYNIFHLLE